MKDQSPSFTAQWVAWMRHLASELPSHERLAHDPFARRFVSLLSPLRLLKPRGPVRRNVLDLQIRTRFIDDAARAFAADGGQQVVILGAGFDARGARLDLPVTWYEVDHPATQAVKIAAMGYPSAVRYLAWHFERDRLSDLPSALEKLGHDAARPTLVIWEGVTMYLTPRAIDDTLAAVRSFGPGSKLVFNYFEASRMKSLRWQLRPERIFVGLIGEPFIFGFDPATIRGFFAGRGYVIEQDVSYTEAGQSLGLRVSKSLPRRLALATVR